jgi:hypothetical protein
VAAGAIWAIPCVAAAFVLRTVAVLATRRRWPAVAAEIDRWWLWAPFVALVALVAVLLVVLTLAVPPLGIVAAIAFAFILYRGLFSASSVGSPFRPRRK